MDVEEPNFCVPLPSPHPSAELLDSLDLTPERKQATRRSRRLGKAGTGRSRALPVTVGGKYIIYTSLYPPQDITQAIRCSEPGGRMQLLGRFGGIFYLAIWQSRKNSQINPTVPVLQDSCMFPREHNVGDSSLSGKKFMSLTRGS